MGANQLVWTSTLAIWLVWIKKSNVHSSLGLKEVDSKDKNLYGNHPMQISYLALA
jgi:hypothetical protein